MKARRPDKSANSDWPVMRARLINRLFSTRVPSPWEKEKMVPGLQYFDEVKFGVTETMALSYDRTSSLTGRGEVIITDKSGQEVEKNSRERIEDRNNHFIDALGYVLFSEIRTLGKMFQAHYYDSKQGIIVKQEPTQTPEEKIREEIQEKISALKKNKIKGPPPFDLTF